MTHTTLLLVLCSCLSISLLGCGHGPRPQAEPPPERHAHHGEERHAHHGEEHDAPRDEGHDTHPDAKHDAHGDSEGDGHAYRHEGHDPHHSFDDPERWAERFEDPERDEWQKPGVVLEALALEPDDIVADIGSATGYFPVKIAPKVAEGRVWGVDVEPAMVRHLNERARSEGHDNLFSILGTPDDPLLPESVDTVLMVNTYHHVTDRTAYFRALADHLTDDGRLVIVDFEKGEMPVGPPDAMKIAPEKMREELEAAGYALEDEIRQELPYQYILVFRAD